MPGTKGGTGNPLTFRCAKCKVLRNWRSLLVSDVDKGTHVESTGFRRRRLGGRGPRVDHVWQYEYRCTVCSHRGWSRHETVRRMWERWVEQLGER